MTRRSGADDPEDRDDRDVGDDEDRERGGREGPGEPRDADEPRGLIRSLLDLLQEMDERGERTRSGHSRPGPHTSVDFSVSVGGLDDREGGIPFGTDADRAGRRDERADAKGHDEPTAEPHVTTRETADGIVVASDLPGVQESEVETRLDHGADVLVIEVGGRDAARLPLQSEGWTVVDSRFSNGVLEVELERD